MMRARKATPADAPQIAKILDAVVRERVSLDATRRTEGDIQSWFESRHPVAVVTEADAVVAFALAEPLKIRGVISRVGELSVFVSKPSRRRGAGRLAVAEVIGDARVMGWWKFIAHVLADNKPARGLLAALEFREVGIFEKHLQIDSVWRDVVIFERLLMAGRRSAPLIRE